MQHCHKNDSVVSIIKLASPAAVIQALSKGAADLAILNNTAWIRSRRADIEVVGEETGETPDNTLIFSRRADPRIIANVSSALLALKDDQSQEARAVRSGMGIKGFVVAPFQSFRHTFELIMKAHADSPSFKFSF